MPRLNGLGQSTGVKESRRQSTVPLPVSVWPMDADVEVVVAAGRLLSLMDAVAALVVEDAVVVVVAAGVVALATSLGAADTMIAAPVTGSMLND